MATNNQNLPVRVYQKQFRELMQAIFRVESYFGDFFAGGLEALDGVSNNAVAFSVKTSDIPVVVGTYNTGENVAFGTGTGNSTRFGPRTEIIYTDTDVPYTWVWTFHEGIDTFTVNNDVDAAMADRLELQARAKTEMFNTHHGAFIAANAGHSETLADYTADSVLALFNALAKYYTNLGAPRDRVAKVNADLYNAIVDHPLTTTAKSSTANIDGNNILRFKGFRIEEIPEDVMNVESTAHAAFVYVPGIGKAFTGINTVRTIPSEDFDGVALQGAGRAGEFILDDNKPAVVKVTAPVGG